MGEFAAWQDRDSEVKRHNRRGGRASSGFLAMIPVAHRRPPDGRRSLDQQDTAPAREAFMDAQRISKFGALRLQMQYVGRLMRDVDPEPIRARLDAWKGKSAGETARMH